MSIHSVITNLAGGWRDHAATLRDYGADVQALALEKCAEQLELGLRAWRHTPLTLAQASALGGYSTDHLGRLIREGKIPNASRALRGWTRERLIAMSSNPPAKSPKATTTSMPRQRPACRRPSD